MYDHLWDLWIDSQFFQRRFLITGMTKVHVSFCFSPHHIKIEKAIVLKLSPTISAMLQMLERPEKEKKQAEIQNSNMQSRYSYTLCMHFNEQRRDPLQYESLGFRVYPKP
jgi:hypothetical protein